MHTDKDVCVVGIVLYQLKCKYMEIRLECQVAQWPENLTIKPNTHHQLTCMMHWILNSACTYKTSIYIIYYFIHWKYPYPVIIYLNNLFYIF